MRAEENGGRSAKSLSTRNDIVVGSMSSSTDEEEFIGAKGRSVHFKIKDEILSQFIQFPLTQSGISAKYVGETLEFWKKDANDAKLGNEHGTWQYITQLTDASSIVTN